MRDKLRWTLQHRWFTFAAGATIGLIMGLVAFDVVTDLPDYALGFGAGLLFFGVLITLIATPFIMFELSQGRNAVLAGALGVGWGYSMIEFIMWFVPDELTAANAAELIISVLLS